MVLGILRDHARSQLGHGFLKQARWMVKHNSAELRADREVVTQAVMQDPLSLKFASEELKTDRLIGLNERACSPLLAIPYS